MLASATAKTTAARACVVSILALALVGCASMAPVPFEEIGPGDRVSVTTKDGRTLAFEVVEVADGSIRGEAAEVPLDQIVSVRAMRTDSGRTALAVLGAVTVAYVLVAADVADKIIDSVSTLDE